MQETQAQSLGLEDPPEEEMAITAVFLSRKSMDRGALQATVLESQRVKLKQLLMHTLQS